MRNGSRRIVKPPFGYYGAKQRIASRIVDALPPHNAWVEAFCGSAAVTLAKSPAEIEVINDLDGEIVNLFKQLRSSSEELCRLVALTPYAREEFLRTRVSQEGLGPMERARRFLVRTMMGVNGTVGKGRCGFSFSPSYARNGMEARVSRWYNLPDRLTAVAERLRTVRIENRDARELLRMFSDRPATLIYLDPPYLMDREHGYENDARGVDFHEELLDLCIRSRAMIIISGYENRLYRSILTKKAGWTRAHINTHTRDTKGNNYSRIEVLWKNAAFASAEKYGAPPLTLTKRERDQNKLNPPRKH